MAWASPKQVDAAAGIEADAASKEEQFEMPESAPLVLKVLWHFCQALIVVGAVLLMFAPPIELTIAGAVMAAVGAGGATLIQDAVKREHG